MSKQRSPKIVNSSVYGDGISHKQQMLNYFFILVFYKAILMYSHCKKLKPESQVKQVGQFYELLWQNNYGHTVPHTRTCTHELQSCFFYFAQTANHRPSLPYLLSCCRAVLMCVNFVKTEFHHYLAVRLSLASSLHLHFLFKFKCKKS